MVSQACIRHFDSAQATPSAHHRVKDTQHWWKPIIGYLLAFLGILIARGAFKIDHSPRVFWEHTPHGVFIPWIQNTMPRDVFNQWQYNIHFFDNKALPKCGEAGWDALQKIQPVLDF